ncbi:MAG TPA: LuxR C-terminal-related transcriptional regulator [Gryllotalpicola sp.]
MSDPDGAADREDVVSAIYLALSSRRFEEAADLAERHWATLVGSALPTLRAVADSLPEEVLAARPRWEHIKRYLGFVMTDASVRPVAYIDAPARTPHTFADRLVSLTARGIAARTSGRIAEARSLADAAVKALEEAPAASRRRLASQLADGYLQWGLSYEFAALEPESLAAFEAAFNLGVALGNHQAAANAAGELAWLHALCGRGRIADEWIQRAVTLAESTQGSAGWRRGDVLGAAVRSADGMRPDLALQQLEARPRGGVDEHRLTSLCQSVIFRLSMGSASPVRLLSELRRAEIADAALLAESGENAIVIGYAEALIHLYSDQPERALELLDGVAARGGEPFVIGTRAIVKLAAGAAPDAARDAERAIAQYAQWPRLLVPASLVKAVIAADAGDADAAAENFLAACELADENGILSTVCGISYADFMRLMELTGSERVPEAVRAFEHLPLVFAPARRRRELLTAQELRVLRGLAGDGGLADLAARMHLSLNTLKAHTRAIYRKLDVKGRAAALRAAHDRGLI